MHPLALASLRAHVRNGKHSVEGRFRKEFRVGRATFLSIRKSSLDQPFG